jgi:hypothetical protein
VVEGKKAILFYSLLMDSDSDVDLDADPDPSIFIIDLQEANKKLINKKFLHINF